MRFYYSDEVEYEEKGVVKFFNEEGLKILEMLASELSAATEISEEGIEKIFTRVTEKLDVRMVQVAQTGRMALTGKTVSPGIYEVVHILGRERAIQRIKDAIGFIEEA
jgi:glutamyl-tRNA synthetase